MSNEYKNNHYVPIWYQKRFMLPEQQDNELFYLNLSPDVFRDSNGGIHRANEVKKLGPRHCFAEDDLYTVQFGTQHSTEIEKLFFGRIDRDGNKAVEYYANFSYPWDGGDHFQEMMMYMSTQKLRTPKGLEWLSRKTQTTDKNQLLRRMLQLRQLHCAIWTESIWLIADASQSNTKFIISDHPVTVYNRACGPQWCRRNGDPDIWLNATHTIFPLSLDKILILTNLSWVRDPYQNEKSLRPNPNPFRNTIFKVTETQTLRSLSEEEVQQINFIIKSQARQYLAAAKEEWLYPEKFVSKSDWYTYGNGYLLMPDPRSVTYGGQMIIGHNDGTSSAFDEYGRRPGQPGFKGFDKSGVEDDWNTFQRFKGEFARLFGPYRRGRSFEHMQLDNEYDDEEYHQYHLDLEKEYKNKRRNRSS